MSGYPSQMTPSNDRYADLLSKYRRRVDAYVDVDPEFANRWRAWCRRLLGEGGRLVVPPRDPEPDLDDLLASAVTFAGEHESVAGKDNDCHANVAALWVWGQVPEIGTGYALSEDGLWRQHSWGLRESGVVVETTYARLRYVGIRVPQGPLSLLFALNNDAAQVKAVMAEGGERAAEMIAILRAAREEDERADQ